MRRLLFTVLLLVTLTAQAATNFVAASTQYLSATVPTGSISSQTITISLWFKTTNTTDQQVLCHLVDGVSGHSLYILYRASTVNKPVGLVSTGPGTSGEASVNNGVVSGAWTHICGVVTSASSRAIFVNGTKGTETTLVLSNLLTSMQVGRWPTGVLYTDGQISDFAMWSTGLTDAEVTGLSKGDSPLRVRSASLIEYWPMVNTGGGNAIGYKGYVLTNSGTTTVAGAPAIYR